MREPVARRSAAPPASHTPSLPCRSPGSAHTPPFPPFSRRLPSPPPSPLFPQPGRNPTPGQLWEPTQNTPPPSDGPHGSVPAARKKVLCAGSRRRQRILWRHEPQPGDGDFDFLSIFEGGETTPWKNRLWIKSPEHVLRRPSASRGPGRGLRRV